MYIESNLRCPTPPSSIKELYESYNIDGPQFCIANWNYGPHIGPKSKEDEFHANFQYVKTRQWLHEQNPKKAGHKLRTKALLVSCQKKGYGHEKTVIRGENIYEVSLPNGPLWVCANDYSPYVIVAFVSFAIFAEYETADSFLDTMNSLLKYLADSEIEYKEIFENAKNNTEKVFSVLEDLSSCLKKEFGNKYDSVFIDANGKIQIELSVKGLKAPTLILSTAEIASVSIDQIVSGIIEFQKLFASKYVKLLKCRLLGELYGCSSYMEFKNNIVGSMFSKHFGLEANLREETYEEDFKQFFILAMDFRKQFLILEDVLGEGNVSFGA